MSLIKYSKNEKLTDLSFESDFESTSLLDMPTFFRTITEIFRKNGKRGKKRKTEKEKKEGKKRKEKKENSGTEQFFVFSFFFNQIL